MTAVNLREVPDELYRKFKAKCAMEGKSVKDKIVELMEKEVKARPAKRKGEKV